MRTAQEIYETVVTHLRKQGCKSVRPADNLNYICMYRSPDGMKCAVGCLIPDTEYSDNMESKDVRDLLSLYFLSPERLKEFTTHKLLLSALQDIHDNKPIFVWEAQWRMLADDFGLKYLQP